MGAILGFIAGFGIIIWIVAILWYFLSAFGFYRLAKNAGVTPAWIAWIPFLQFFLLGKLDNDRVWGIPGASWILVLGHILIPVLANYVGTNSVVNFIYYALTFVFYVYLQTAYYDLYKIYAPNTAVLWLVLGIIFPFLIPIFVFIIRDRTRYANVR